MQALENVANEVLPREMGFEWADISYQQRKASGTGNLIFLLSLVCVFLILAALYESWSLPFSVLLSVPIAVFGAFAGLLLRNYDFDVYGQIRARHARRSGGEECHSHRRICQGSSRKAVLSSRPRWRGQDFASGRSS